MMAWLDQTGVGSNWSSSTPPATPYLSPELEITPSNPPPDVADHNPPQWESFYGDPASGRQFLLDSPEQLGPLFQTQPALATFLLDSDAPWLKEVIQSPQPAQEGLSKALQDGFSEGPSGLTAYFLKTQPEASQFWLNQMPLGQVDSIFKQGAEVATALYSRYPTCVAGLADYNPTTLKEYLASSGSFAATFAQHFPAEAEKYFTAEHGALLDNLIQTDPTAALALYTAAPSASIHFFKKSSTYAEALVEAQPPLLKTLYSEAPKAVEELFLKSRDAAVAMMKSPSFTVQTLYQAQPDRFNALFQKNDAFLTQIWKTQPALANTLYQSNSANQERVHTQFNNDDAFAVLLFQTPPVRGEPSVQDPLYQASPERVQSLFLTNVTFAQAVVTLAPKITAQLCAPPNAGESSPGWDRASSLLTTDPYFASLVAKGDPQTAAALFAANPSCIQALLADPQSDSGVQVQNFAAELFKDNRDLAAQIAKGSSGLESLQMPFLKALVNQSPQAAYQLYLGADTQSSVTPALQNEFAHNDAFALALAQKGSEEFFQSVLAQAGSQDRLSELLAGGASGDKAAGASFAQALVQNQPQAFAAAYKDAAHPDNVSAFQDAFQNSADFANALFASTDPSTKELVKKSFLTEASFQPRISELIRTDPAFPKNLFFQGGTPDLSRFESDSTFALRLLETAPDLAQSLYTANDARYKNRMEGVLFGGQVDSTAALSALFAQNPSLGQSLYADHPAAVQALYQSNPSFALATFQGDLGTALDLDKNDSTVPKQLDALYGGSNGPALQKALYGAQRRVQQALGDPTQVGHLAQNQQFATDLQSRIQDLGGLTGLDSLLLTDDAFAVEVFGNDASLAAGFFAEHPSRVETLFAKNPEFVKATFNGAPTIGTALYNQQVGKEQADRLFLNDDAFAIQIIQNAPQIGQKLMDTYPTRTAELYQQNVDFVGALTSTDPSRAQTLDQSYTNAFKEKILEGIRIQIFKDVQKIFQDQAAQLREDLGSPM